MKRTWAKKEYLAFGVIIAVVISMGIISVASVLSIQGNAKVVNFAGIVRGGTQKLIKEEIMGWNYLQEDSSFAENSAWYPNDALMNRLDTIVNELLTGDGPNGLMVLHDDKYLSDMRKVKAHWEDLKKLILEVRAGETPDELFDSSQAYFALVNDAVFSAEAYTGLQVKGITVTLIAVNALSLFLVLAVLFYYRRRIEAPMSLMETVMTQLGTKGDLNFPPEVMERIEQYAKWNDVMGSYARAFNGVVTHISDIAVEMKAVSKGDLTIKLDVLSENDAIGVNIQNVIESLHQLFGEINTSTVQVSNSSRQISDGAQALAQGSSEQASFVAELSSSVVEIAEKTKSNANMADQAATLANTIKVNAEKGSRQMDEMMAAVNEINEASGSISKVIKVIDDIAFQTNILALNAAVEAARAGQHGKGFAVVAEEVRNLAAKSADAAKDTGALIENSIEKANLGVRIAGETAESLTEIVRGINESSQLVTEIARSSEEQSFGIAQINDGIEQVTQIVQQNSAVAEESAAASEEMSRQSDVLHQLIARFKLKG